MLACLKSYYMSRGHITWSMSHQMTTSRDDQKLFFHEYALMLQHCPDCHGKRSRSLAMYPICSSSKTFPIKLQFHVICKWRCPSSLLSAHSPSVDLVRWSSNPPRPWCLRICTAKSGWPFFIQPTCDGTSVAPPIEGLGTIHMPFLLDGASPFV